MDDYSEFSSVDDYSEFSSTDDYSGFSSADNTNKELTTAETVQATGQSALDGLFFGLGDEIAAGGRALVDEAMDVINPELSAPGDFSSRYESYVAEGRDLEQRNKDQNPLLAYGTEIGTSLLPAAKLAGAVGNAATRLGNVGRQAGVGAGEMAVREFGEGEGDVESRLADIDPLTVGIGAAVGGAAGGLMRGQRSIDAIKKQAAKDKTAAGNVTEAARESQSKLGAGIGAIRDDLYANVKKEIGDVPAREMVDADHLSMGWKQALHNPNHLPVKDLDNLTSVLKDDGKVRKLLSDAGAVKKTDDGFAPVFSSKGRTKRIDLAIKELDKTDPAAAETLRKMNTTIKTIQQDMRRVFPKAADDFQDGYFPIQRKAENVFRGIRPKSSKAKTDSSTQVRETGFITEEMAVKAFDDPVHAFMSYFEDSVDALALARSYNVKVPSKSLKSMRSYSDEVIKAVVKSRTKELGKEQAQLLGDKLAMFAIDGRQSMGAFANVLRTASHAALLGTPENALLQAGDLGQAAYGTSFLDAVKALPKALKSVLITDGDMVVTNRGMGDTIRMADIGLTRQHLTELVNENRSWLPKHVTKVADFLMQVSGVRKANRLGVETFMNAQVGQMRRLASQGKEALRNSPYADGLTEAKLDRLYKGIQSGNVRDNAVKEAVFFKLGRFQPVSRTGMPPAWLNARNGRLLWSMKMYMTKMASRFNEDIIMKTAQAEKAGLNTPEGLKLMREALLNTGKYSSFVLALNSFVDPGRKELLRGKESERDFPAEFARQGVSFATGGVIDPALSEYGISPATALVPPAVAAGFSPIELAMKYIQEGEVTPAQMERAAMFIPGARQILWADEVMDRGNN